jgi:tetratricopeptide (TPR) repeat protein
MEIGVPFGQALSAEHLGKVSFQQRRPEHEVMGYYEEAKRQYQQLEGYTFHSNNLAYQIDIHLYLGEMEKRFDLFEEENRGYERTGQYRLLGNSKNWEALFAARYSSYEHALKVRHESLGLALKYGSQSDIVWCQFELGDVHRIFGHPEKALELYDLTLGSFEKMNMLLALGFNQRGRGDITLKQGDISKALDYYQKYLDYAEEDNSKWGIVQARSRVAMALAYLGNVDQAHLDLKNVLLEVHEWRQGDLTLESLLTEPICLLHQGKNQKAIEMASFIKHHHLSWNETKQHAAEILEKASEGLTKAAVKAAVESGKQLSLDEVVDRLIKDNHSK